MAFAVLDLFSAVIRRQAGAHTFRKLRLRRALGKRIALFIGILLGFSCLVFGPYLWNNVNSAFLSKQEILATSASICLNETDVIVKANKIADWLHSNVEWDNVKFRIVPFYWRKESPSPEWVMSVRRGACEENAVLFAELARSSDVESRLVYNLGEDHVWNEIWVNGSWVHFDATLSKEDRLANPGMYERSRDDGGWGKRLSYVYAVDLNGTRNTVTEKYTDTGNLIINVKKDGVPVENASVTIRSMFLMDVDPDSYEKPLFAVENYTAQAGNCSFHLGQNNYTVIAQVGDEKAEKIVALSEGTCLSISLNLAKSDTPLSFFPSLPAALLPILFSCLMVFLFSEFAYFLIVMVLPSVLKRLRMWKK